MSASELVHPAMNTCLCGAAHPPEGPDPIAYRDYRSFLDSFVTGLCQACQDLVYLGIDPESGRALPIIDGSLVSVRVLSSLVELVLLPFRLVVPSPSRARLVWDARLITRAGPWLDTLDLSYQLDPLQGRLIGHQVRLTECASFDDPQVSERLAGLRLLLGLDRPSLDAIAAVCQVPATVSPVALVDSVPWVEIFSRSLLPLTDWFAPEPSPISTLRSCAVMAALLTERGRTGTRPIDHLVEAQARLFLEESDERS